jgi:hypothetical protein
MNLIFLRRLQHGFNFEIKETHIYILLSSIILFFTNLHMALRIQMDKLII